jgi:hypothetical protein
VAAGTGFRRPPPHHPLAQIDALPLTGKACLRVVMRRLVVGERWAFAGVAQTGRRSGPEPVVAGQISRGPYAAHNWVELSVLTDVVKDPDGGAPIRIAGTALELRLLRRLARLVPSGGHVMVEYESPHRRETFDGLLHGVPPVATPLGLMLFLAGTGDSFKDWYYAEGGMEGPRKLQGNRALNAADRRHKWEALRRELQTYLRRHGALPEAVRARARTVLDRTTSS